MKDLAICFTGEAAEAREPLVYSDQRAGDLRGLPTNISGCNLGVAVSITLPPQWHGLGLKTYYGGRGSGIVLQACFDQRSVG
jgi:hypothetical protein